MKFIKLISISSLIAVGALLEAKTWIFPYNKADSGDLCFAKGSDLKNWEYIGGKDRAFFHSNLGAWGDKKTKELCIATKTELGAAYGLYLGTFKASVTTVQTATYRLTLNVLKIQRKHQSMQLHL